MHALPPDALPPSLVGDDHRWRTLVAALTDRMLEAVVIVDLELRVRFWSSGAERLFGWTAAEAAGRPFWELTSPAVTAEAREVLRRQVLAQGSWRYTGSRRTKDGRDILTDLSASVLYDAEGRPEAFLAVSRDVTERESLLSALHRAEWRYRSVLEAMREGVVIRRADGRYESLNPAAEDILGVAAAAVVDRHADEAPWRLVREDGAAVPPDEHPAAIALRERRPVSHEPLGVWRADGTVRWVVEHCVPLVEAPGTPPYAVLSTLTDVSDAKHRADEIREREARLQEVLEASTDGYIDHDLGTRRVVCSARAAEMLGLSAPPQTIDDVLAHVSADDRARIALARAEHAAGRTPQMDVEYRVQPPGGEGRWVRVRAKAVERAVDGRPRRIVGTITDVTARHRLQMSLMEAIAGRNRVVEQLQDALAQVKTLRGLPVCAWCNKIESERGWQRIEAYIAERTEATVSHGICPDCAARLALEEGLG